MKVKYSAHIGTGTSDYGKMPLLHVRLKRGKKIVDLDCLVDSGAGICLFNKEIAHKLGIDLRKSYTVDCEAVGGSVLKAKISTVHLQVAGFDDEWLEITGGFISEDETPLLGHLDFFDKFEITFRSYRNEFEIKRKNSNAALKIKRSVFL